MSARHQIDYGPAAQKHRVVREARPDIDNPNATTLGARTRDGLRELLARGVIGPAHWLAGERLRDDIALAGGIRANEPGMAASAAPESRTYADGMLDAIRRVDTARVVIGDEAKAVVAWVVVLGDSLAAFVASKGMRKQTGLRVYGTMLVDALDRLDAHYSGRRN